MKKTTLTQLGIVALTLGLALFTLTGTADAALSRTAPLDALEQHEVIPSDKVQAIETSDSVITPTTDYLHGEIGDITHPDGVIAETANLVPWELLNSDYMGLFMKYFVNDEG